ncbi:hypothetical protein EJ05DRAFT_169601 [Pseudovirgaria hyperparasitica]|uniref:Uncharacterized protein n=1 Tax=Pseudovirgaria hyperparasitica TaxID=470096 RepID=A0A6A6VU83_9PEZI|nr:uncharacterized protein EJ05DRAFT_169601 [Pseudovirgaria hyperparasitica]KAF2753715.1 hypothetical protein EJ05DRAFT_169601 [Pseudovirgaria hyperparasitica]
MAAPPASKRASLRLAHIPPPHPLVSRQSSPELGDTFFHPSPISLFSASGRPLRKTAGKKPIHPQYVDSTSLVDDLEGFSDMDRDTELDTVTSDEDVRPRKTVKKASRKRKRSPSPPPAPPLSPIHSDVDEVDSSDSYSHSDSQPVTPIDAPPMLSLTFNVPKGFTGPFVVQLDPSMLMSNSPFPYARSLDTPCTKVARHTQSSKLSSESPTGFMTLPPELRNKIYRMLFLAKDDFKFWHPDNFCRSATFLSTCKQIHQEGTGILYGENTFCFERSRHMRGQYWSAQRKEIGYKDMRRFLTDIGPRNLAAIRKLSITLEDANPSSAPHEYDAESRRFVHDEHLFECLRQLARGAQLKWLRLSFQGRRRVGMGDHQFVGILKTIRTDKLDITPNPRYSYHSSFSKIDFSLELSLKRRLVRKEKLYENAN